MWENILLQITSIICFDVLNRHAPTNAMGQRTYVVLIVVQRVKNCNKTDFVSFSILSHCESAPAAHMVNWWLK
jgi:hypothetical protein